MANKPDYKSFKFIENSQAMRGQKVKKRASSEINRQQEDAVVRNLPGVISVMAWEDPVHGAKYSTSPSESEESKGRRKIYIKKNVMNSDMPEMVAFFQDSNYHFVRDIFKDRTLHCEDDCLVENCELDHDSISSILNFVENSSESSLETLGTVSSISNESKLMAEVDCKNDVSKQHVSQKLRMEEQKHFDRKDYVSIENITHETQLLKEVRGHLLTHS